MHVLAALATPHNEVTTVRLCAIATNTNLATACEHMMHPFSDEESMGETLTMGHARATLPRNAAAMAWPPHAHPATSLD